MINVLARQATPEELGGKLSHVLADCTLTSRVKRPGALRRPPTWGRATG
jgi:hypothetical protein